MILAATILLWVDALSGGAWAGATPTVLVVALLALGSGLSARPALLVAAVPVAVLLLTIANQIGSPGQFTFAGDVVFYTVVVGAPALIGALVAARRAAMVQLEARRAELERRRATVVRAARAAEAERVELEVGETLADRLREIIDGIATASWRSISRPETVPAVLASVEVSARAAIELMREVLGVLRPSEPSTPLPAASATPVESRTRTMDEVDVLLVLAVVPLIVETSALGTQGRTMLNVLLACAQGLALALVRRRPLLGAPIFLTVACVQSALVSPLPPTVSWMLPGLLMAFLVGHTRDRRTAWAGLVVMLAGVSVITLVTPAPDRALDGFAPALVMGVLAWLAGRALADREARIDELQAIGDELDRTRDQAARLAATEQRADLARELHDVGAHALTVVCLQAGAAQTWWDRDREKALEALGTLDGLTRDVLTSLSASLAGPATTGSGPPLNALADLGRALGLTVDVRVEGTPRHIADEVSQVLFRVVQESLTNAARHAQHTRVEVGLAYGVDCLEVHISDDGPQQNGEPVVVVPGSGLGLPGMAQRVEAVSGQLSYGPSGCGYKVHARLPLAMQP